MREQTLQSIGARMPSIGRFLEVLEAVSRHDWPGVAMIIREVAEDERSRNHFTAARQLLDAAQVATQQGGYGEVTELSYASATSAPPLEFLQQVDVSRVHSPFLPPSIGHALQELVSEWNSEAILQTHGVCPRNKLLLCGPPGTGKTLLAKHLSATLRMPLYLVRFDSLVSSYLGQTASNLQRIFAFFSANRCILLLDEVDAIAKMRDDKNELGELKRVVISLLQNIEYAGARSLLIAATNHPQLLDPALWRRFDPIWELPLPSATTRTEILRRELPSDLSQTALQIVVDVSEGMSGSDIAQIAAASKRRSILKPEIPISDSILISLIDWLRRRAITDPKDDDSSALEKLIRAALSLREIASDRQYSFVTLEEMTGVPHSTLHHRSRKAVSA